MTIKNQIMSDIKVAMRAREQDRLTVLRGFHSAIKNKEIELRPKELSEPDIMAVLKTLAKQRKDSIEQFTKAGRTELADKEKFELSIIESYLPEQMGREQIEAVVLEVISALGATDIKQMGQVMKEITAKTNGTADNKIVSEIVRAKLQAN